MKRNNYLLIAAMIILLVFAGCAPSAGGGPAGGEDAPPPAYQPLEPETAEPEPEPVNEPEIEPEPEPEPEFIQENAVPSVEERRALLEELWGGEIVYEGAFPDANLFIVTEQGKKCQLYIGMSREEADRRLDEAGIIDDLAKHTAEDVTYWDFPEDYCRYVAGRRDCTLDFYLYEEGWVLTGFSFLSRDDDRVFDEDRILAQVMFTAEGLGAGDPESRIEEIYGPCPMVEMYDGQPFSSHQYSYKFDQYYLFAITSSLATGKIRTLRIETYREDYPLEYFSAAKYSSN